MVFREEIKDLLYNDYITNGYSDDMPTDEFIQNFYEKYHICIPRNLFFDEDAFIESMLKAFENWNKI